MLRQPVAIGLIFVALAGPATTAVRADILFSEPFEYARGASIIGQSGGKGFSSSWNSGGANFDFVSTGGLTRPGVASTGNALSSSSQTAFSPGRSLTATYGTSGAVEWGSFLIRQDQPAPGDPDQFGGMVFGPLFVGTGASFATWGMNTAGNPTGTASGVPVVQGQATLLVVKLNYRAGNDVISLFVNPSPGTEPVTPDAIKTDLNLTFSSIGFGHRNSNWTVDQIRYGQSFADVVPEPASIALVLFPGALLLRRRRPIA